MILNVKINPRNELIKVNGIYINNSRIKMHQMINVMIFRTRVYLSLVEHLIASFVGVQLLLNCKHLI